MLTHVCYRPFWPSQEFRAWLRRTRRGNAGGSTKAAERLAAEERRERRMERLQARECIYLRVQGDFGVQTACMLHVADVACCAVRGDATALCGVAAWDVRDVTCCSCCVSVDPHQFRLSAAYMSPAIDNTGLITGQLSSWISHCGNC